MCSPDMHCLVRRIQSRRSRIHMVHMAHLRQPSPEQRAHDVAFSRAAAVSRHVRCVGKRSALPTFTGCQTFEVLRSFHFVLCCVVAPAAPVQRSCLSDLAVHVRQSHVHTVHAITLLSHMSCAPFEVQNSLPRIEFDGAEQGTGPGRLPVTVMALARRQV
jgi:hypothetical protein